MVGPKVHKDHFHYTSLWLSDITVVVLEYKVLGMNTISVAANHVA